MSGDSGIPPNTPAGNANRRYPGLLREELIEFREYQDAIARNAVDRNTLIVIPTALGKTVIAVIAISVLIDGGGKCIFLAPTRPLVHQHSESMRKFLDLPEGEIAEVTGEVDKSLRGGLYRKARIIVSTPQVIDNDSDLLAGVRDDVKVVVFDEAHRATGDYSYVSVAEYFSSSRIIATTASPGGDREKINEIMRHLRIENLEVRDEYSHDVVDYIKGIDIEQVRITAPPGCTQIIGHLNEMMDSTVKKLESFGFAVNGHSRKEIIALGDYIFGQIKDGRKEFYAAVRYRTQAILIDYLVEFAETQGVLPFYEYLEEMKRDNAKARPLFADGRMVTIEQDAMKLSGMPLNLHTPKISKVIDILKERNSGKVIVFCHYRVTANILSGILKREGFSCEKFIGQSSRNEGRGMSQKEQASTLQLFRDGAVRILVATQVGEEGLDVPAADTVIFYEPVASEVRSIQRRGRTGRFGKGKVFVLIMENSRDMAYYYSAGRKENRMKNILREDLNPGKKDPQMTFDSFGVR
ncbi:MAG: hypothetical protein AMDU3_IPLC00003G0011 [Thermoplasmatales archaeon I-plasma]|nr:MAG: hypothetical protein AMDU3_IPLC00003G0011 [Thermoplasmatales archaeon I-plasma]